MTLKERLQEENVYINAYNFKLTKECAEKFEEIADKFTIGFSKWLLANCRLNDDEYWQLITRDGDVRKSGEELLEIYKKEKGL